MNLDIQQWKEFRVGDLFDMVRGHTLTSENKEDYAGHIPCINGTSENNGVQYYLSDEIAEKGFQKFPAPAITIVRVGEGGKTFVQTEDFFVADNAFALLPRSSLNQYHLLFLSSVLDLNRIKYSYGRTVTSDYIETNIKLPVDCSGNPDWQFMEDYMKSLHHRPMTTKNKAGQAPDLNVSEWKEFRVTEIFTAIEPGKISNASDLEEGQDIPYLGAKKDNNGMMQMCVDVPEKRSRGNCVIMICDGEGSVGLANYMESDFLGTVNLMLGYNDTYLNPFTGLFVATVLSQERPKYSFGRKWKTHISETTIKLPADADGNPDWLFMENYMKSLPYGDRLDDGGL